MMKEIPNYNSRYSIDSCGRVFNNERKTFIKPMVSTSGYHYVHLVKNRKKETKYIHRLVCEAFLENPENLPQVDHIDGNKLNNSIDNLRWCSVSQNCRAYGSKQRSEARKRKIYAVRSDGSEITFESRKAAAAYFECTPSKIKYDYLYRKGTKNGWKFFLK